MLSPISDRKEACIVKDLLCKWTFLNATASILSRAHHRRGMGDLLSVSTHARVGTIKDGRRLGIIGPSAPIPVRLSTVKATLRLQSLFISPGEVSVP